MKVCLRFWKSTSLHAYSSDLRGLVLSVLIQSSTAARGTSLLTRVSLLAASHSFNRVFPDLRFHAQSPDHMQPLKGTTGDINHFKLLPDGFCRGDGRYGASGAAPKPHATEDRPNPSYTRLNTRSKLHYHASELRGCLNSAMPFRLPFT